MEEYEQLLERALQQTPKIVKETSRFQVPKAEVTVAGSQTLLKNLRSIASTLNREPEHLARFLLKELAAAGAFKEGMLVLHGRFSQEAIQSRIEQYVKEFVICRECGKPDTRIEKVGKVPVLRCEACGARNPVRSV
jgi:translation initiation factor 2 subunit 2